MRWNAAAKDMTKQPDTHHELVKAMSDTDLLTAYWTSSRKEGDPEVDELLGEIEWRGLEH